MPICITCGKDVPGGTDPTQDQSTFICDECQDVINLEAWKDELKEIQKLKEDATPSQITRGEWLQKKIKEVEKE